MSMGMDMGRLAWISMAGALLVGCVEEPPGEGSDELPMITSASANPSTSGEGEGSGGATGGPASGPTTTPSADSSSGGGSDDGPPGISFDLGIPDVPDGKIPGCQQAVDIVFTMDVSTTMASFINILADEILAVDAAIQALEMPLDTRYGLAVFVDDAVLLNGGAPYADADALRTDFLMWSAFAASNQQVGGGNSNSTWPENSLDAIYFAADGFQWREAETTIRMIIHTTDDTFWDGPTIGNGIPIQHGYAETVQRMQDQEVRGYVFADDIGGACVCEDVTPGWSAPYMGMLPIPEATDGAVYDINEVLSGIVSLADAINGAVEDSYCDPYTPVG
ncbi:MAG: hypothetical protein AAGF11_20865 [Myxococcota bacterium]